MTEQQQPNVAGILTLQDVQILVDMAQRAATPAERQWLQLKFGGGQPAAQAQPAEEESEDDNA